MHSKHCHSAPKERWVSHTLSLPLHLPPPLPPLPCLKELLSLSESPKRAWMEMPVRDVRGTWRETEIRDTMGGGGAGPRADALPAAAAALIIDEFFLFNSLTNSLQPTVTHIYYIHSSFIFATYRVMQQWVREQGDELAFHHFLFPHF